MLSAVLRSKTAIAVSVRIMNAFVEMRRFIASNALMLGRIDAVERRQLNHEKQADKKFDRIFDHLDNKKLSLLDIKVFNSQYPSLEVRCTTAFHDRFLILDGRDAYHIGASIKDAGKKSFAISPLMDETLTRSIIQRLCEEPISTTSLGAS